MKTVLKIILLNIFCILTSSSVAQHLRADGRVGYEWEIDAEGDTVYTMTTRNVFIYPPLEFKNKAQEKFYWKTVRDVKKTLPYAHIVSKTLNEANAELSQMLDKKERKAYLKNLEKQVIKTYEKDIRKMTFSQGKMLIRLIDRQTNMTSYELIQLYRGKFSAFFWQSIARLFGANLKDEYDGSDKDRIVERVITLVEAGQL